MSQRHIAIWAAFLLAISATACGQKEQVRGPGYAVEQLRRALATNDRTLMQTVTDERLAAHIAYFHGSERAVDLAGHSHGGQIETISPAFFAATYDAMERQPYDAFARFRAARVWLGAGRCADEGPVQKPDAFAPLRAVDRDWPANLQQRHGEVNTQLARTESRRFRCAPNVPVTVVFVRSADPHDPPKILAIELGPG